MDELISRQAAIEALKKDTMGGLNYESILNNLPRIKAVPVRYVYLRRSRNYLGVYECSECGVAYPQYVKNSGLILNYCSKCGSKFLRGED